MCFSLVTALIQTVVDQFIPQGTTKTNSLKIEASIGKHKLSARGVKRGKIARRGYSTTIEYYHTYLDSCLRR